VHIDQLDFYVDYLQSSLEYQFHQLLPMKDYNFFHFQLTVTRSREKAASRRQPQSTEVNHNELVQFNSGQQQTARIIIFLMKYSDELSSSLIRFSFLCVLHDH
jgi:hypothetical protein